MHAGSDNSSNYIGKKDEERGIVRIHSIVQWYVCFQKSDTHKDLPGGFARRIRQEDP